MSITKSFSIRIVDHFTGGEQYNFDNIDLYCLRRWDILATSGYRAMQDIIAVDKEGLVMGCISLWISDNKEMITLSFIEVDKQHRKKNIAKKLVEALCLLIKATYPDYCLFRTPPSASCPNNFTNAVSRILDRHQIRWIQKNDFDDYFTSPNWDKPISTY